MSAPTQRNDDLQELHDALHELRCAFYDAIAPPLERVLRALVRLLELGARAKARLRSLTGAR